MEDSHETIDRRMVFSIGSVGLLIGAITGWVGLLTSGDAITIARLGARLFPSLILLVPLVYLTLTYLRWQEGKLVFVNVTGSNALIQILTGFLGALLAILVFGVLTIQIPAVFGGSPAAGTLLSLVSQVGWVNPLLVLGATLITAAISARFRKVGAE